MEVAWIVSEFDPLTADPEQWRRLHQFRRARWEERADPTHPYLPDETFAEGQRENARDQRWARYRQVVTAGDQTIASFYGQATRPGTPDHDANGHLLMSSAGVLSPWRHRGLGRRWLMSVLEWMALTEATTLTTHADELDGHAFLRSVCGEPRQLNRTSRVDLLAIDWAMVDRWVAQVGETATGYRLELHERRLAEALWPEYCAAVEDLQRHAPLDALDMGDWHYTPEDLAQLYRNFDLDGTEHHVALVRDEAGAIVAVTDVAWAPFQADHLHQFNTAVHPRARGLGLGKWVKARMLQVARDRLASKGLRWVVTTNATSNAAMLSINERLGFRPHLISGTYQADRAQIERYLSSRA